MKHIKYLKYIILHKWFVFVAGIKTRAPIWNLFVHDWSKMLPSEWIPYANFFYGNHINRSDLSVGDKSLCLYAGLTKEHWEGRFNEAWLHHQKRNKHHWQYWVLHRDDGSIEALAMPQRYIREMVADWAGAGRTITGKWEVAEWYKKNRSKMVLHPSSDYWIEGMLKSFS